MNALRHRRVARSAFARAVAVLAGGTALAQLIGFVVAPVLSRLYSPHDFGLLAVFTSVIALWAVVSTLRYERAVPLPADHNLAASVLAAGGAALALSTVVGALLTAAFGHAACRAFNAEGLTPYLWLLPVSVLLAGAYQLLYHWALRQRSYRRMAATRLTQALARAAVQCAMGALRLAPEGLLAGHVIGGAAGTGSLWRLAKNTSEGAFAQVRIRTARDAARRYIRFATYGTLSGLLSTIGLQAVPLGIAYLYGAGDAGLFALTQRVLTVPLALVGVAIGETYVGVAPEMLRADPGRLRRLFLNLAKRLFLVGLIPVTIIMLAGPWLFALLFGEPWYVAGEYARYLAPAALLQLTVSPLTRTSEVFERQDLQALADSVRVALLASVFGAAYFFSWEAPTCLALVSGVTCISYGLYFCIYLWLIHQKPRHSDEASHNSLTDTRR